MAEITKDEADRLNEIDGLPLWRISNDILKESHAFVQEIADRDLFGCRCKACVLFDALDDELMKRK